MRSGKSLSELRKENALLTEWHVSTFTDLCTFYMAVETDDNAGSATVVWEPVEGLIDVPCYRSKHVPTDEGVIQDQVKLANVFVLHLPPDTVVSRSYRVENQSTVSEIVNVFEPTTDNPILTLYLRLFN